MSKNNKTFWPYAIFMSIVACIIACAATIIISIDYPVEMDNSYLQSYQNVDSNINEIMASQKAFEAKFDVAFEAEVAHLSKPISLEFAIKSKDSSSLDDIVVDEILLTRPETNSYNKSLKSSFVNGILKTEEIKIDKVGRWQVLLKLSNKDSVGFYKFEFFATE